MADKQEEAPDFSLSVRDPRLRQQRKGAIKVLGMAFVLMTVAVWALLSIFWGSTCKSTTLAGCSITSSRSQGGETSGSRISSS